MYYLQLAGEDDRLAIAEASLACDEIDHLAPGVARAASVDPRLADRLALTRSVIERVAEVRGGVDDLVAAVREAPLHRRGTIAVRATSVRGTAQVETPAIERRVGRILTDRGYGVDLDDPDHVLRVLAVGNGSTDWYAGWTVVEPERSYGSRRPPHRPFKQPGTMRPQLARALVNLSGVGPGERLLDPMCGAGAILTEAALVDAQPVGVDLQRKMVEGASDNVRAFATDRRQPLLVQGSADRLPICRADAAVFDAPYGRQSPIGAKSAPALVRATLAELRPLVGTCVAVFDRPLDEQATAVGWSVEQRFDLRVHRSLTRHIAVLRRRG